MEFQQAGQIAPTGAILETWELVLSQLLQPEVQLLMLSSG